MEVAAVSWAATLQKLVSKEADPIPKGFVPIEEVSRQLGVKDCQTRKILNRMVAAGLAEKIILRRPTDAGLFQKPFFRLKK